MSIDRNKILQGYMDSYSAYSSDTSATNVEKVLKYSGDDFDTRRRGDIKTEVVIFKLSSASPSYEVDADKPKELVQNLEARVYVEQSDSHSTKEARYDRMLALSDDLINWADVTNGSSITTNVYTITLTGLTDVQEEDGYVSTTVNFQSIIQL